MCHFLFSFFVLCAATQRSHDKNDDNVKSIKSKYERQLNDLKAELKTLKSAKKEHAKAIRKNVSYFSNYDTIYFICAL